MMSYGGVSVSRSSTNCFTIFSKCCFKYDLSKSMEAFSQSLREHSLRASLAVSKGTFRTSNDNDLDDNIMASSSQPVRQTKVGQTTNKLSKTDDPIKCAAAQYTNELAKTSNNDPIKWTTSWHPVLNRYVKQRSSKPTEVERTTNELAKTSNGIVVMEDDDENVDRNAFRIALPLAMTNDGGITNYAFPVALPLAHSIPPLDVEAVEKRIKGISVSIVTNNILPRSNVKVRAKTSKLNRRVYAQAKYQLTPNRATTSNRKSHPRRHYSRTKIKVKPRISSTFSASHSLHTRKSHKNHWKRRVKGFLCGQRLWRGASLKPAPIHKSSAKTISIHRNWEPRIPIFSDF